MNILIISSNLIGDSILSTGIIKDFIDRYPNSKLTVVVGLSSKQVYVNFPNLNQLITIKKQKYELHWFEIWRKCFFIKWDIIIDFRSSLIGYFLMRKKSYIYKKYSNNVSQINQLTNFFRLNKIAYPIIFNTKEEEKIAKNKLLPDIKYIVIAPGGNWTPKIWSIENFNKLLRKLLNKNNDLYVVLVGSKTEKEKYKKNIINKIDEKKIIDLMGKSITQTHAYMKRCNLFVGNDSGLMHLSAASKIPTIGLFGPTNNKLYSPYGNNCYTVQTKETYENFQTYKIEKYKSYMDSIKVEDVIEVIEKNHLI